MLKKIEALQWIYLAFIHIIVHSLVNTLGLLVSVVLLIDSNRRHSLLLILILMECRLLSRVSLSFLA